MKPAFSVLLLTTLLGVGQGLFFGVYCIQVLEHFEVRAGPQGALFYPLAAAIALGFLAAGLAASFFHLGRPERACRSAAMWRTSWLSREVIVLPALMGTGFLYGAAHLTGFNPVTATISGGWSTDNNGLDIRINGTSLGFTTSFTQFSTGFAAFAVGARRRGRRRRDRSP